MAKPNVKISLKPGKSRAALTITHPNACGIDIGHTAHYVAVQANASCERVRHQPAIAGNIAQLKNAASPALGGGS